MCYPFRFRYLLPSCEGRSEQTPGTDTATSLCELPASGGSSADVEKPAAGIGAPVTLRDGAAPMPLLLHLDPLPSSSHNTNKIAAVLADWLRHELERQTGEPVSHAKALAALRGIRVRL